MTSRRGRPNATAARNNGGIIPDMPRLDGDCVGHPTEMWFTDRPQNPGTGAHYREPGPVKTERLRTMRLAIAICRSCPVLEQCRDYTEQHPEMSAYGIWAGTTGDQRRKARGDQRRRVAA